MEEAGLLPASAPPTTDKQEGEEPEADDVSIWQFLFKNVLRLCDGMVVGTDVSAHDMMHSCNCLT